MSFASPELIAFILENERHSDEGVTVEHIGHNYNGSDRPKKGKFEVWLRSVDGSGVFPMGRSIWGLQGNETAS